MTKDICQRERWRRDGGGVGGENRYLTGAGMNERMPGIKPNITMPGIKANAGIKPNPGIKPNAGINPPARTLASSACRSLAS